MMQAGQMRTQIRIQKTVATGTGASKKTTAVDLGNSADTDPPRYFYASWVPKIKATVTVLSDSTQSLDYATATIRYNSLVTSRCHVVKDGITYQILSASDPDQHRQWLQIDVRAAVNA